MKITKTDYKHGKVDILIDHLDDLWYLLQIIDPTDRISGKTTRKIKKTEEGAAVKKTLWLEIAAEQVELGSTLRVSGTVTQGPEDIPLGSYHSFSLQPGSNIALTKDVWPGYQRQRLEEAEKANKVPLIICVFDREEALIARTTPSGIDLMVHMKGQVSKKRVDAGGEKDFYAELIAKLQEASTRYKPQHIIIASPSFWKEELLKKVNDITLKKKFVQATCSGVGRGAIDEVLRRPEVKAALASERVASELALMEEVLVEVSKQGVAKYGIKDVKMACEAGAIRDLLVTDKLITKRKAEGTFDELYTIMKAVDQARGKVHIISSSHNGGERLDGIGGIACLLRYAL
jgi:protein pelota